METYPILPGVRCHRPASVARVSTPCGAVPTREITVFEGVVGFVDVWRGF